MAKKKDIYKIKPLMIIRGILSNLLLKNMTLRQQRTFRKHSRTY